MPLAVSSHTTGNICDVTSVQKAEDGGEAEFVGGAAAHQQSV